MGKSQLDLLFVAFKETFRSFVYSLKRDISSRHQGESRKRRLRQGGPMPTTLNIYVPDYSIHILVVVPQPSIVGAMS